MYRTWLLPLVALEVAAQSMICSNSNTASSGPNSNIYQSRSACVNLCKGQAAYAVVQFDKCWCSNATPSSTTDGGNCNKPCPGYPPESCGGDRSYAYVLLDKGKIEAAAAPSSSAPSSAPSSQPPPPPPPPSSSSSQQQQQQQQQQESPPPSPASQQPPPAPQIITITQTNEQGSKTIVKTVEVEVSPSVVEDKPATLRTVTVTGTVAAAALSTKAVATAGAPPSSSSSSSSSSSGGGSSSVVKMPPTSATADSGGGGSSGLKQATVAGIAVGGSAAGVFAGLIAFMLWRRYKYGGGGRGAAAAGGGGGGDDDGYFGAGSATTIRRDNTTASEDSRMGAFGQNKHLCRNSIGSLEDVSAEMGQVLRVVNPDMPEKM